VLVLLFVKYVSDKYAGQPFAPITIPPGAGFADMVALKGKSDIGDQINKKILGPLASANKLSDMPDFNDATKLGSGKEMVDRLTSLIAIFKNPALDFTRNRADGDDILGDAYEYLMRHFATESGNSKGQFYTPAEVSRVMAQILGIRHARTTSNTTAYDPTCGSGSLLLKVAAPVRMSLDTIRLFAISKLGWIRNQQMKLREQEKGEPARVPRSRESLRLGPPRAVEAGRGGCARQRAAGPLQAAGERSPRHR
jgi:type I restriction enzyme M protein